MTRAPAALRSAPGPAALHPPSARLRPRSYDLTAELPGLLAGLPHHWGRISSVLVNGTVWSLPGDGMLVADRMVHLRRTDSPRAEHTVCLLAPGHGVQSVAGWRASRRCRSTRCVRGVQSPMGECRQDREWNEGPPPTLTCYADRAPAGFEPATPASGVGSDPSRVVPGAAARAAVSSRLAHAWRWAGEAGPAGAAGGFGIG